MSSEVLKWLGRRAAESQRKGLGEMEWDEGSLSSTVSLDD